MAKKIVAGTVDRVEGDVIVVVAKDPDSGENREIYVKKKQLKKIELKEGDEVTVEMSRMAAAKTDTVSIVFTGVKTGEMAKRFFTYLVDGGLEDIIIQGIAGQGVVLGISEFNKKTLSVTFEVGKDKPAKKAVKKPVKKVVKAPVKVKAPAKKVAASRGKKR